LIDLVNTSDLNRLGNGWDETECNAQVEIAERWADLPPWYQEEQLALRGCNAEEMIGRGAALLVLTKSASAGEEVLVPYHSTPVPCGVEVRLLERLLRYRML
jgi:hypothetical protein